MIVANQDYIAHFEPICKALNLVKVPGIHVLSGAFITNL